MKYFFKHNFLYTEKILMALCELYELVPTDCLKDDNEITISDDWSGEPIWVFEVVAEKDDEFYFHLTWQDHEYLDSLHSINTNV